MGCVSEQAEPSELQSQREPGCGAGNCRIGERPRVASVEKDNSDDNHKAPTRHAKELTEMAALRDDPGERAWLLQWAKAFRKLAALGENRTPGDG